MHFSFSFIQVYYYRMKIMKNKLTNSQTNKITAISQHSQTSVNDKDQISPVFSGGQECDRLSCPATVCGSSSYTFSRCGSNCTELLG